MKKEKSVAKATSVKKAKTNFSTEKFVDIENSTPQEMPKKTLIASFNLEVFQTKNTFEITVKESTVKEKGSIKKYLESAVDWHNFNSIYEQFDKKSLNKINSYIESTLNKKSNTNKKK
jgi:hypothetical protein